MLDLNDHLFWIFLFFVIFYIYIDLRFCQLRKEMLSHYLLCEKLLTEHNLSSQMRLTDIIPTRYENKRIEHFSDSEKKNADIELNGLDVSFLDIDDNFASFSAKDWLVNKDTKSF